jgi:hypothetical protein
VALNFPHFTESRCGLFGRWRSAFCVEVIEWDSGLEKRKTQGDWGGERLPGQGGHLSAALTLTDNQRFEVAKAAQI